MLKRIFYILIIYTTLISCKTNDYPELPDVYVEEFVNLNLPANFNLQSPGGWVYIYNAGIKGIIVYNVDGVKFMAYERSCPHLALNDCSILDVVNNSFVECKCDKTTFILATGSPVDAPVGLKVYRTSYISDGGFGTIYITN